MAGYSLTDALGVLHSTYPQARVTSGYRDPNSPLGRENPRSYHNFGQAFDVAPIPGVSFGDYVNTLKKNGMNVVESLDEASHPAFDTTGPNWHIAFAPPTGAPPQSSGGQPVAGALTPPYVSMPSRQSLPPAYPLNGPNQGQNAPSLGSMANQPVSLDTSAMPYAAAPQQYGAPSSLGELAASLPGGVRPRSKFSLGNALGIIGDGLMAYSGMKPTYGPFLQEQQVLQQQQNFEREKFNAELRLRMATLLNPGIDTDLGHKLIGAGVMPGTPQWTSAMGTSAANDLDPLTNTAQGPVLRSSVVRATQPPAAAIARLRSDLAQGDASALAEFEQMYGPGSSIRALGAH